MKNSILAYTNFTFKFDLYYLKEPLRLDGAVSFPEKKNFNNNFHA